MNADDKGQADDQQDRPQMTRKTKMSMLFVVMSLAFVSAEVALRFLDKDVALRHRMSEGSLYTPFVPNGVADHCTPEFRVRYTINQFGFRDRPRTLKRSSQSPRILLLGDSFSVGWGIPQDQSYGFLLEEQLGGFELWNTARSGNNPLFYLAQLRHFGKKYNPDALLIQIFDNDPKEIKDFAGRFEYDSEGRMTRIKERYREPGFSRRVGHFFNNLALRRGLKKLKRTLRGDLGRHHFTKPGRKVTFTEVDRGKHSLINEIKAPTKDFYSCFGFYFDEKKELWREDFDKEMLLIRQTIEECKASKTKLAFLYIPLPHVFIKIPLALKMQRQNPHRELVNKLCQDQKTLFVDSTSLLAKHKKFLQAAKR